MEDAAGFFANVFGGERFMEYVGGSLIAQIVCGQCMTPSFLRLEKSQ
jgi:hypothetical protein